MWYVDTQSAAVKDVDIADILDQKYRYRIDIGKDDVDTLYCAGACVDNF